MPRPHPPEFRQRAVELARLHEKPIARIAEDLGISEEVVAEALASLSNGPTCFATEDVREGVKHLGAMSRNDAARLMLELDGGVMGPDQEAPT